MHFLDADYDQYYASLAASQAASAQATPSGLSVPGSADFDDFGDDDEEDRKPSVEYLDSLNDYRKRSRSVEDEGTANSKSKLAKIGETLVESSYNGYSNGGAPAPEEDFEMMADPGAAAEDDPIVYGASSSITLAA